MMQKVFKALSGPSRRRVLELLKDGPLSAGELSDCFESTKPTMSAHFSILREAGLIASRKDGKQVIYHLNMSVLEEALSAFASEPPRVFLRVFVSKFRLLYHLG